MRSPLRVFDQAEARDQWQRFRQRTAVLRRLCRLVCVARDLLWCLPMSSKKSSIGCVLAFGLAVSSAWAAPRPAIRIGPETAPPSIGANTRTAFRLVVTSSVAGAGFSPRRGYTAYPSLVELRRYVEPGETSPTVACVVSIAVTDDKEILIATVRGSATSRGGAAREVLQIATQSAVKRLVKTLESNERSRKVHKPTATRQ
jgi:hypothetical protein